MDFITRFNGALRNQRHNELIANHADINEEPKCKSLWAIESQMRNLYTRENFLSFQDEIEESNTYRIDLEANCSENEVYYVKRVRESDGSRHRRLVYNKQLDLLSCSCKKFKFQGIPCRHMLVYFRIKQLFELPDKYILHRWTKNAKVGVVIDKSGTSIGEIGDVSLVTRHGKLSHAATLLVDEASLTEVGTDLILNAFEDLQIRVRELNGSRGVNIQPVARNVVEEYEYINDPSKVRAKGCGKRLKASKEKTISKERLCHGCRLRGQSHDKRNCPKLNDSSVVDDTPISSNYLTEDEND